MCYSVSATECFIIDFSFIYHAQINHIKTVTVKANPFKLIKNYFMWLKKKPFFSLLFVPFSDEFLSLSSSLCRRQPLEYCTSIWRRRNTMQLLCCNFATNRFTFSAASFIRVLCYMDFSSSLYVFFVLSQLQLPHVRCVNMTWNIHDLEACHRFRHRWIACKNAIKSI